MAVATRARVPAAWSRARQRFFRFAPADGERVVLRHSRIYILPSRRGWTMIGTLAIMLLTSLNYALSLGFLVTFALAGLVAAALLHAFRNLAGIEIRPLSASETFAGGRIAFTLSLAGGERTREAIEVRAEGAEPVVADIPAGTAVSVRVERPAPKRGHLALGRVTLASVQPLGLWQAWSYVHFPLAGVVYPEPEPGAPPLPRGAHGQDLTAPGQGDESEFAGLRDYQPGDAPQRVAWKAVARGAGWYTKEFDGAGGGGPVTLDWSGLPRSLDLETRLARLTAWVLAAERAARPFALRIPGGMLPVANDRNHRRAALTMLAVFPSEEPS
ncbi:MAG TPA: DUF58 domain-containing protein [Casimicrobiaceae bacterium]|jgi:uncharacterized protein (DUF58 family)|nr:DUF58 domain-containing protein [Casimicrobiaceae bacterium]